MFPRLTAPCLHGRVSRHFKRREGGGAAEALHERPGEAERGKRQEEEQGGKMKDKEEQVG